MTDSPAFAETLTITSENPLLHGHVVYGRSLLPGVGYVDLVLQMLARQGVAMPDIELRNVTILAPLVAAPGEQVQATIEGRPAPAGGWRIEVRSRRPEDTTEVVHAVVAAHRRPPSVFRERLQVPVTGADRLTSLTEIYSWCREHQLHHSGLMKIDGVVHHRPGDWIAELELAPEYHGTTDAFLFHPALFEAGLLGGGVGIGMLHAGNDGQGLYLPLLFESFRAQGVLGKRCFVRVPAESVRRDDELIRMRVEFYDTTGMKVADIGQFVAKCVRAATNLDVRGEPAPGAAPAAVGAFAAAEAGAVPVAAGRDLVGVVRDLVAARLEVPSVRVDVGVGYYELGLASADLLSLVADLEDRLSVSLSPTVMFEHKTVADLAAWLETQVPEAPIPRTPAPQPHSMPVPAPAPVPAPVHAPRSDTDPADLLSAVRTALTDEVSALLEVPADDVDLDGEFAEFGFDWAGLAHLTDRLNDRYGLALASTVYSEHRTVRAMAAHLVGTYPEHLTPGPAESGASAAPTPQAGPDDPAVRALQERGRPHAMLHRPVPDDDGVAHRASFGGDEPYLRDHQVRGHRILPGVAHLEMAREAVARTLGEEHPNRVRLENVVWLRPAICGPDGLELTVDVRTLPGGGCEYEIHSPDADGGRTLCSQGRASVAEAEERGLPLLDELRAGCAETVLPAEDVYGRYHRMGLVYGPAQRSLVNLGVGTDDAGRPQALAELELPTAAELPGRCGLHPSIMDGALHAGIGLWPMAAQPDGRPAELALPFALERMTVSAATPAKAYAWIRHQRGSGTDAASARLDVTLFDEQGRVCVDLNGVSSRALPDTARTVQTPAVPIPQEGQPPAREEPVAARPAPPRPEHARTDIAIVGVSGRYPEAADLGEFWENLRSGRDCIREVPAERWDHRRFAEAGGSATARWGGFLDGIDRFDPLFFQISPLEADYLDPQERLFLECVHHTLEDAGHTGESLARTVAGPGGPVGKVGVFVGVMYQEYQLLGAQAQERGERVALWGSASTIANRVSYFYDFHGPSMAVDTMCSSSLTSIHLACEAIKSGQCDAAIAGGVNLSPHPNKYLVLSERRFLSSDGRCRSFGEGGDGYVPGEGVGAVLLKPLERAVADGDHIYGVIKGTALNHGGRTTGYSVPTPVAQGEVIAAALTASGVDPRALSYLEAHGTGTSLGDPIEIAGLTKAFQQAGGAPPQCAIGSVKSNIGHTESAAGIAGVTKVLLQLEHKEMVPSLHADRLNPHIDFARTPLRVQRHVEPWRRPTLEIDGEVCTFPRIAGVSGFGGGGSNAHVVIAEYEPAPRPAGVAAGGRPALLVLSAQSEAQLADQARRLSARLAELGDGDLQDVAWTLQVGRMALQERLALAAASLQDARAQLDAFASDPRRPGAWTRGTVRSDRGSDDEALRTAVADWSGHGAYDGLLRLWADGAAVNWEAVHPSAASARRVSLPGYPFARERYWLNSDTLDPDTGRPLAALAARSAQPAAPGADGQAAEQDEMLLLRPGWVAQDAAPADGRAGAAVRESFAEHHVVVIGELPAGERDALRTALPADAACRFLEPVDGSLDRQYTEAARQLFAVVRGILERGVRQPVLLQVALAGTTDAPDGLERLACFGGLAALLKTAHLENPFLRTQFVECLDGVSAATVAARLVSEAVPDPEPEVRHRGGQRYVGRAEEVTSARAAAVPWKEGGVYLITGGAGGLGLIVAREIAASVHRATVVLTGRSPLSEERRDALNALRSAGLTVNYQRADVADRAAVARVLAHVADNHGQLTGILHAAGVIEDNFVLRKSPEELERVLAPKVAGLVHLDESSRELPLEVFLCFSSLSGAFGNPGQADYAAANAFMDAYAAYRNRLVDAGLGSGRTVSVGWPLWDEGSMGAANHTVREHLRSAGLAPLDTARGLTALRCALAPRENGPDDGRLLVVMGRRSALLPRLTGRDEEPADGRTEPAPRPVHDAAPAEPAEATDGSARALEDRAVKHLRPRLAAALKLGPERLDPDTPLERYGMDSVLAVNLIGRLEQEFGSLSRTLLFEVQTVRGLARYFAAEHPQALRALLGEPVVPQPARPRPPATPVPATPVPATPRAQEPAPAPHRADSADQAGPREPAAVRDRGAGPDTPGHGREIAIIGIGGRYPQAEDLDTFWANLRAGKDAVTEVPADRWDAERSGRGRWGAFLDGVDRFDPLHFGISPREAAAMDPQQRLFLETVWHLLEQSGVTQEVIERRYGRRVGVYVGTAYQMYRADESDPTLAALTSAASYNLIANRVSHFFGLEGPSLAVDSMCTSSTMAIHLACADLLRGESELAIAGGVNLTVHPDKYLALSEMQLLGSHPGSRSFRDGDGYLPAEAVGAVLLKPLDAAIRDGDTIHAVIKSTASMHGGRSNGFMTPSHRTQVSVMRRALERAGAGTGSIGYVEAAANGTAFSDEVEVRALREVFHGVAEPVALGTVKSNLGHPEAASGIAQLTKVVLQLRHGELVPLVGTGSPNPNLDLDGTPLTLCDRLTAWEPRGTTDEEGRPVPRRALINSVAAGGSHVSLVIEAPPRPEAVAPEPERGFGPQLVVVSGRTPERLRTAARRLHDFLDRDDSADLADLAYTSQLGREALPERLAVVAGSTRELKHALAHHLADGSGTGQPLAPATPVLRGNAEDDTGPLSTVLVGARGEAFLAGLVADGDLESLAALWVHGTRVPWSDLHRGRRRLLPLPATAFEAGSYWIGRKPAGPVKAEPPTAAADGAARRASVARPGDGELTDTELTMISLWSELLQIEAAQIEVTTSFFSLGGNSLMANRLINLVKQRVGVELPVQALFDAPRLADMAAELERRVPRALQASALEVDRILESIDLIERMSDEELAALDTEK
ncbi:SDR family NAD(P)-dependent oxidoreductase [Streptomyces sp. NPDC059679]|uniref:SDR family NAD(P)-dependent oxidoreductase n=1 Tax=Streptomyces sp. NPDC059679 TaxID=3346903 RepID=UPI00369E0868